MDSLLHLKNVGLSNLEILRAATSSSAEMLGLKIGIIALGYQADLLVLNENPLKNIDALRKPFAIIKKGRFHCLSSLKDCKSDTN